MTVTRKNWYNTLEKFGELNRKNSVGTCFGFLPETDVLKR